MELTKNEITSRSYDLLMCQLCPWGSSDVWHMIKSAESLDVNMYELAEILREQAESWDINLYNDNPTTDVNALFNDYILNQAASDIYDVLDIDIIDKGVYFFANYLDDPLQYSTEVQELIEDKIKGNNLTENNFNKYALYIFNEMGVAFN